MSSRYARVLGILITFEIMFLIGLGATSIAMMTYYFRNSETVDFLIASSALVTGEMITIGSYLSKTSFKYWKDPIWWSNILSRIVTLHGSLSCLVAIPLFKYNPGYEPLLVFFMVMKSIEVFGSLACVLTICAQIHERRYGDYIELD